MSGARRAVGLVGLAVMLLAAGCSSRAGSPFRVATGYVSHVMCSQVFVVGQDPKAAYAEHVARHPSFRRVSWALHHEIDGARRQVTVRLLGGFESRAVYRDGLGCLNVNGPEPADAPSHASIEAGPDVRALLPELAGPDVVEPRDDRLKAAIDRAFDELARAPYRLTRAVVVVHDGRMVGERYAPGYGVDTPLHGWSATKSVASALVGILVRQGRLSPQRPAPVTAWQSPGDPRHAITVDELLRMTSGLALGNSLTAGISSAWDTASRALFNEADLAGFAEGAALEAPPGAEWKYANGNTAILARIVRDAVGGHAVDVLRFARRNLFAPLGMRHVTMELDATGTPIAGAFMFAPPRDWARFGLLMLNDGVVGGVRVLPEGWVRYCAAPTPSAFVGYGAGWWTNQGDSDGARYRVREGMPEDAIMAVGIYGQFVVVVPSERLVIARFGTTYDLRLAMQDIIRLTTDTVAAIHESGG